MNVRALPRRRRHLEGAAQCLNAMAHTGQTMARVLAGIEIKAAPVVGDTYFNVMVVTV